jgi:hypothetical protein
VCRTFLFSYALRILLRRKKKKESREAESLRHMKIKISYTLEDGHVDRNI